MTQSSSPRPPDPGRPGDDRPAAAQRPRTRYVDWADFEAKLARPLQSPAPRSGERRVLRRRLDRVEDQAAPIRADVRDAVRAVLQWLSLVVDAPEPVDLEPILRACLRPGPDVTALNYEALAREIHDRLGIEMSAKRIRTAVAHLRRKRDERMATDADPPADTPPVTVGARLDRLRDRLATNFDALAHSGAGVDRKRLDANRDVAVDLLAAVRCVAGRLIESEFGEGIPDSLDLDTLEGRYLDFVRDAVRTPAHQLAADAAVDPATLPADLHRLLVTMTDYDGTAEADARFVVEGARVVASLTGPDALPGLVAQLNVLVSGRGLLDSELYVAELRRLAEAAYQLRDDPETSRFVTWVRRLPPEARLPSPVRVASYCLNNMATHALEGVYLDRLTPPQPWIAAADDAIASMRRQDSGFALIATTRLIREIVRDKVEGDDRSLTTMLQQLGEQGSCDLVLELAKVDNCAAIIAAARSHAVRVHPNLLHAFVSTPR